MPDSLLNHCPLCQSKGKVFYKFKKRLYHQCSNCQGIFVDHSLRLTNSEEKERYEEHNNDVHDPRFRDFVSPITNSVLKGYTKTDVGLDFGAGPGPVIAKVLEERGYNLKLYDPYYYNTPELLQSRYDYIICCEVIEHFHRPFDEFKLLRELLKINSTLYCMTDIYNTEINFHNWYYKNDKTHVFIYQKETLDWIKEAFNFVDLTITNRLITFSS